VFDTLNLRRYPPLLSAAEDVDTLNPFGINRFANTNIAPSRSKCRSCLTGDGKALNAAIR
jgi:hypothetical protein